MGNKAATAYPNQVEWCIGLCRDTQSKAYLDLGFRSGLRVSEMVALDWSQIDLLRNEVKVIEGKGRDSNDKPETVFLRKGWGWLQKHWQERGCPTSGPVFTTSKGTNWATSHVKRMFVRLSKQTGKRISSHSLRHGFALETVKAAERMGKGYVESIMMAQSQLRHRHHSNTEPYLRGLKNDACLLAGI